MWASDKKSKICSSPWYLSFDNSLFIVKDETEPFREMTPEEKQKYMRKSYGGSTNTGSMGRWNRPEATLKITVKQTK